MNLTKIKNECYNAMVEAIKSEIGSSGIDNATYACATVDTNDGYIELVIDHHNDTSVVIVHDNGNEHDCPLLCKAIEENLPDWDAIEEEWQEEIQKKTSMRLTASETKPTISTGSTDRRFSFYIQSFCFKFSRWLLRRETNGSHHMEG